MQSHNHISKGWFKSPALFYSRAKVGGIALGLGLPIQSFPNGGKPILMYNKFQTNGERVY
jgi:hypothetical protein